MRTLLLTILALAALMTPALQAETDPRLFEMRVYYAAPGKLDALNARFRDHTLALFQKHSITSIGYWMPIENPDSKLVYILAYPDRAARDASWKAFMADPDWKKAHADSEKDGKLVARIEQHFLNATDYSVPIVPTTPGNRVFELRTYTTTSPETLTALHARFRDHTVGLFSKHGMTHIGYWQPVSKQGVPDNTLIYILAHASVDAAKASFGAFRADPDWLAARKASEEKAGGSLTIKDGVKSEFMTATDYSPTR